MRIRQLDYPGRFQSSPQREVEAGRLRLCRRGAWWGCGGAGWCRPLRVPRSACLRGLRPCRTASPTLPQTSQAPPRLPFSILRAAAAAAHCRPHAGKACGLFPLVDRSANRSNLNLLWHDQVPLGWSTVRSCEVQLGLRKMSGRFSLWIFFFCLHPASASSSSSWSSWSSWS